MPDLTILLDCPIETGLARTRLRTNTAHRGPDRVEGQDLDFHRRVRDGFMALARADSGRFRLVDSNRPREQVFAEITRIVDDAIGRRCPSTT